MAMRITTKMMQNTSLNNLNTNKALQDKLTTQLATGKKLTRPSDDPVVAIRSLKLNSALNKTDQYYEKNTNDAQSWLELTEDSLDTVNEILSDIRKYATQCANGDLTADDRATILENITNFKDEIYSTGNATSESRYIFTGYRTDTPLTLQEDKTEKNTITEQINNLSIDTITHVVTGNIVNINSGNFTNSAMAYTEYDVTSYDVARIRLAYDDLDYNEDTNISLSYFQDVEKTSTGVSITTTSYIVYVNSSADTTKTPPAISYSVKDLEGKDVPSSVVDISATSSSTYYTLTITDQTAEGLSFTTSLDMTLNENNTFSFSDRTETSFTIAADHIYQYDTDDAYASVYGDENANEITYIAETGELLLGSNVQQKLAALSSDDEIRITYDKSNWEEGDLDPVHYFYTERYTDTRGEDNPLIYNEEKLTDSDSNTAQQIIEYDVGSSQSIRVNTTADEVYTHGIGRDVDELYSLLEEYDSLEDTYSTVQGLIDSGDYDGEELETLELQLAALDKARTYAKDALQSRAESIQTDFDEYIDQAKLVTTDIGSRLSRVELVQNRLSAQQTSYEELVSDNEDADYTELAIQLSSVELTYEAALSSISYVMKTTLLDYI